jgi:hypothetical protein
MKQTINKAAKQYNKNAHSGHFAGEEPSYHFINGARSQASKDFHTQGMYSEEELKNIACNFFNYHLWNETKRQENISICFDEWFEHNGKKI